MPDTNIATCECVVYWLYDDKCVCLWKHGYVGITVHPQRRFARHRRFLKREFSVRILYFGTPFECMRIEEKLRPFPGIGWNKVAGGALRRLGHQATAEARRKMSEAGKRRAPISEETREKQRIRKLGTTNRGRIGQKKSDAERAKISAGNTGKVRPNPANYARYGNTSHLGYKHSEETKERIRTKKIGVQIHSEEHKRKLAERLKGNSYTKGKSWSTARRLAWVNKQTPSRSGK